MEMKVQGRRKSAMHKIRWLDSARDDIRKNRLSVGWKCTPELHGGAYQSTSIPYKSGTTMKRQKLKKSRIK